MKTTDILLEKSLIDCHCKGLDSLVIKDGPRMVRMFVATPGHQLYKNTRDNVYMFSVALHRHHCDVTLMPILGEVWNITPAGYKEPGEISWLSSYRYVSPITTGEGKFEVVDPNPMPISLVATQLTEPTSMPANHLHTIFVPYGRVAAWFVWEGAENPKHNSIVYSNDDLTTFDFSELDKPMTEERLKYDLALIGVKR